MFIQNAMKPENNHYHGRNTDSTLKLRIKESRAVPERIPIVQSTHHESQSNFQKP